MDMYARALKWPVISWIAIDAGFFLIANLFFPKALEGITNGHFVPLLLGIGAWAGSRIVEFGGNYLSAIIAGVVVGFVCALFAVIGVGVIVPALKGGALDVASQMLGGFFLLDMNFAGAVVGGGYRLTK